MDTTISKLQKITYTSYLESKIKIVRCKLLKLKRKSLLIQEIDERNLYKKSSGYPDLFQLCSTSLLIIMDTIR